MNEFIPLALACGHLLEGMAWYEMPAEGSGDPALVECPNGCGMVEFVLPVELQGKFKGENVMEIDLGYVDAGGNVEIRIDSEDEA